MNNKKLYLSNTSINTFLDCSKKFEFKYIKKQNYSSADSTKYMSFGNSMHAAIAEFNMITDKTYRTLDVLHNLLRKNWIREGYASLEEEKEFGLRGLDMLTQYYNHPQDKAKKNLLIEEMIYKDCKDYVLCGKLDKIYQREDDVVEVLDYKTGKVISPLQYLQLAIYLILAQSKLGYYPKSVSLYYLPENEKIIEEVDENFIEQAVAQVEELCNMICNTQNFEYNPTTYCKTNCEFYGSCEAAQDANLIVLNTLKQIEEGGLAQTAF